MDERAYDLLRVNALLSARILVALGTAELVPRADVQAVRDEIGSIITRLPIEQTGDLYEIDVVLEERLFRMVADD